MSTTKIEWSNVVWNPTTGCDRISDGCDNCYALTMAKRLKAMGSAKYQNDGDPRTSGPGFGVAVHGDSLTDPLRWRKPRKVFVNSMSDLFHARVPATFVKQVFDVMAATPQHTYQVLTKRATRLRRLAPDLPWPSNVWMGVSVESAAVVDRIDDLRRVPAAVRFLSCEPLLGPLGDINLDGIGWVIAGGESGPKARPMHPLWVQQIRDQCATAGVPFFFKQWGEWAPLPVQDDWRHRAETDHDLRADGYHWPISEPHDAEDGSEVLIRRFGKAGSGRELDGRKWDEFPTPEREPSRLGDLLPDVTDLLAELSAGQRVTERHTTNEETET